MYVRGTLTHPAKGLRPSAHPGASVQKKVRPAPPSAHPVHLKGRQVK